MIIAILTLFSRSQNDRRFMFAQIILWRDIFVALKQISLLRRVQASFLSQKKFFMFYTAIVLKKNSTNKSNIVPNIVHYDAQRNLLYNVTKYTCIKSTTY